MEIWITFDDEKLSIVLDPARVKVGTPLIWRFLTEKMETERILWAVYFNHGSPLHHDEWKEIPATREISATTELGGVQHVGATDPAVPNDPHDYKYGVRVENMHTWITLWADDPMLIVTR